MQVDKNNTQQFPQKLAYGISDAVAASSMSRAFLYNEIQVGRLKTFKVGKRTLIAADDLNAWLQSFRNPQSPAI